MGTVLHFKETARLKSDRVEAVGEQNGEIVIFPGVRIERHGLDLGHRLRDAAGHGDYDGLGGKRRPRKTS